MKPMVAVFFTCLVLCLPVRAALAEDVKTDSFVDKFLARPSCVLMKFTNKTRYKALDSDSVFADLVLEKMIQSRRFHLSEMQPIGENVEKMLYDEKTRAAEDVKKAQTSGNLSAIFEGARFDKNAVQAIDNAQKGQIISPEITVEIGKKHKANYLIHGTVINIGTRHKGKEGSHQSALIDVTSDVRIIEAATGKVIWAKRVTGTESQDSVVIYGITFGTAKLNSNLYSRAMNDAAEKLVNAIIEDMDAKKLVFS